MLLKSTSVRPLDHPDRVIAWRCDVRAAEILDDTPTGRYFLVGRILADEIRPSEIENCGENVYAVADGDSAGLEAAWAALLDEDGNFREDEFTAPAEPVVYLYRFALHPDFAEWRMAVMDDFSMQFGLHGLILAQFQTTLFSETEFHALGFKHLPRTCFKAPPGLPNIDRERETRFLMRHNVLRRDYELVDYPDEAPPATEEHEQWVKSRGPWKGLN